MIGGLDPHHRMTRGSGGVHGTAAAVSNEVRNLLMLCRPCHDLTLSDAARCIEMGWVIERRTGVWPEQVPAKIHTVNGRGWWFLTEDGGYRWADDLNIQPDFVLTYGTRTVPDEHSRVPSRVQARDEPCADPAACDIHKIGN